MAGISGDMILGALLGLGGDLRALQQVGTAVAEKTGTRIGIKVHETGRGSMRAKRVEVDARGKLSPEELRSSIEGLASELDLSPQAHGFSKKTLEILLESEKNVHLSGSVHLHELGSSDTLVDILGTAKLLDTLGFFKERPEIYASTVLLGSGTIKTSHGTLSIPTPVTAEILRIMKIPFRFSSTKGELATPTGIALLGSLSPRYRYPPFPSQIKTIGVGAGGYNLKEGPNIMRIMLLVSEPETERISVLQTSLDDTSGEVLGYLMEKLYAEGALDVQILPTVTKKNRPGHVVIVLCNPGKEGELAEVLMRETGSLGVRVSTDQMRYAAKREVRKVKISLPGYEGSARVKISILGGSRHLKAEYEDAKRIAKATHLPLKDVIKKIETQGRKNIT
jgi:hypothetical protein